MIINQTISVGGEPKCPAEGNFIFVASADGLVEVTTNNGRNYSLNRWDQVQLPMGEELTDVSIRNMHDSDNHVVIKTGHGKFYPANDGGSTTAVITAMPNIQLSAGQSFAIDNLPAVQAVKQSGSFNVNVNDFPTIQAVKQGGSFNVSVNNLPAVQTVKQSGSFDVSVNNLPDVQKVESVKSATYAPQPKADFTSNNHVIAENLARSTLIIKASNSNLTPVWVGASADNGLPLFAGESIELSTTAEINLFAENITDNCYISEVI